MTPNVILRYFMPKYHDAFAYPLEGNDYFWRFFLLQVLTQYFESFKAPVIKFSPELNADCKCPNSKLEIRHKSRQVFITQKCWRQILYFCMFILSHLFPVDVIWRFMSHVVEKKAENCKKLFIVTFHLNRRKNNVLEMVRFLFRSVYN